MKRLENWINSKFTKIASQLPKLVEENPASFTCGHVMGYKQALLDICSEFDDEVSYYYCADCKGYSFIDHECAICGETVDNDDIQDVWVRHDIS